MNSSTTANSPLFLNIHKIKTLTQLRRALKHNKREIAKELGAGSHIDSAKSHLNYSLTELSNCFDVMQHVHQRMAKYQKEVSKAIRHDAIVAIEVVFSVSAAKNDIDLCQYFSESFQWSKAEFSPATPLSADVHLDESNPHLHVIFLCVTEKNLVASLVTGYKRKYRDRSEGFYYKVAHKHGLELPPPALNRMNRNRLAQQVIDELIHSRDPITQSQHYPAICQAVRKNPVPFAIKLNLGLNLMPPKPRTVAQIFTSRGQGSNQPKGL